LGFKSDDFNRVGAIEIHPSGKTVIFKIGNNDSAYNNLFFCAANYIENGNDTLID